MGRTEKSGAKKRGRTEESGAKKWRRTYQLGAKGSKTSDIYDSD